MSGIAPKLAKGGLILLDPDTGTRKRIINLQYNPDSLTRTLQPMGAGADSGDHLETLRLRGAPIETIKLEAELDAADGLSAPDQNPVIMQNGLAADLAALETMVYPTESSLQSNQVLSMIGTIEIFPTTADLVIFVWGRNKVVPVRLTEFTINEEAFDPNLNPIRAKVSLTFRVLSTNDLPFDSRGASIYLSYHRRKESLAKLSKGVASAFRTEGLP
jgi:hypothetical protein